MKPQVSVLSKILGICLTLLSSLSAFANPSEKVQIQKVVEERLERSFSKIVDPGLFVLSVEVIEKSKSTSTRATVPASNTSEGKVDQNDFLSKLGFESNQSNPTFESSEARAGDWFDEIKLKVTFDESVKDESIKVLSDMASDMISPLQGKKLRLTTQKVSFSALASAKVQSSFDAGWDQKRWLYEMGVPLGIVFAGLLLAVFALLSVFLFVSKFSKVEKAKMTLFENFIALQAEKNAVGEVVAETPALSETPLLGQDASHGILGDRASGVDAFTKFQTLISEQPERALRLVQQWLHGKAHVYKETLAVLARHITPHELAHLFKDLKDEERREWRRALRISLDASVHSRVEDFLSKQIVDVLIVAKSSPEESIMNVLGKLGMEDFAKIAESDAELGAALLNILNPDQASKLVSILSAETFQAISVEALNYKEDDLAKIGKKLEAAAAKISAHSIESNSSPFMERIPTLLREADAQKEQVLFNALVEAKEFSLLQDLCVHNFPSALIPKLPQDFLRSILMAMPSTARAELIFSLEENLKVFFLDSLGDASSKARSMVTDEIDEIKEDAGRIKRIENKKHEAWGQFLKRARASIQASPERLEAAKGIVQNWIQEIGGPIRDEQQGTGAQKAA